MSEIVTVAEMYAADRYAAEHGVPSLTLMENAGAAVAGEICRRWRPKRVLILCGPGNNGGDGYVVARHLGAAGWDVRVAQIGRDGLKGDASHMSARWRGLSVPLTAAEVDDCELVVDALFGAGLQRPLEGVVRETVAALNARHKPVIAVDVPSGLHGDFGKPLDDVCVEAALTVTFFRKKPAHVLMTGRLRCGHVVLSQIGIPDAALEVARPALAENGPEIWSLPRPGPLGHKYARGHTLIISGPAHATGAARLAARGALRIGSGLVSVASPPGAIAVNAAHLTAIMVKPFDGAPGLAHLLEDKRYKAVAIGPGCGVGQGTRDLVGAVLNSDVAAVLDADALTSFSGDSGSLFQILRPSSVLTPHDGEFTRVFPDLLAHSASRIEAARDAAARAGCLVLLKGPDTIIADPNGRVVVTTNAPPELATAGSGDVLSGFIAGLMAQGMESFQASCAAVWLHAEAAKVFGPGLISEDLPEQLPAVLRRLYNDT
ncbi:MAG: NAD(P)H-hydrate dehydratase [Alphaproteobacteria bacterium]|nr:NAD(P)H-hydrate dehydratase [Alphaproteobacteria bacterium]